jgi:hypothetical protein
VVKFLRALFGKRGPTEVDARANFIEAQEQNPEPWAMFEIIGFEDDGRIKVSFNWNKVFISHLDKLGFTAETEEDTVQLFFYASQMRPTGLSEASGDPAVQTSDLPNLSENVNRVAR